MAIWYVALAIALVVYVYVFMRLLGLRAQARELRLKHQRPTVVLERNGEVKTYDTLDLEYPIWLVVLVAAMVATVVSMFLMWPPFVLIDLLIMGMAIAGLWSANREFSAAKHRRNQGAVEAIKSASRHPHNTPR